MCPFTEQNWAIETIKQKGTCWPGAQTPGLDNLLVLNKLLDLSRDGTAKQAKLGSNLGLDGGLGAGPGTDFGLVQENVVNILSRSLHLNSLGQGGSVDSSWGSDGLWSRGSGCRRGRGNRGRGGRLGEIALNLNVLSVNYMYISVSRRAIPL